MADLFPGLFDRVGDSNGRTATVRDNTDPRYAQQHGATLDLVGEIFSQELQNRAEGRFFFSSQVRTPAQGPHETGEPLDQLEGVVAGVSIGDDNVTRSQHELVALNVAHEIQIAVFEELVGFDIQFGTLLGFPADVELADGGIGHAHHFPGEHIAHPGE